MDPGKVLVIQDDVWTGTVPPKYLRARGHDVEVVNDARSGFTRACEWRPDCIVCTLELPDIDGFWVARRIRTEPTSVSVTPFLLLTTEEERQSRLQGLNVGADAYLVRPFSHEEVVAQVERLIDMARRLRVRRDSSRSESPTGKGTAFNGDLELMSLATVLMVLGMERRTGRLRVVTASHEAELVIVADSFASAAMDGREAPILQVLREVLRWKTGNFYFQPLADSPVLSARASVNALLLEAIRLDDETAARR